MMTAKTYEWLTEGFHAKDGWYFKREPGGDVRLTHLALGAVVEQVTFPLMIWGSIVASMSAFGEDSVRLQTALTFHGGMSKLENDATEAMQRNRTGVTAT